MIGLRILPRERAVAPDLARKFLDIPVANVGDCMSRMFAGGPALRPMHRPGQRMAGPAVTVKTRPGDNLLIHKALWTAAPGDVLVVDGGGDLTNALFGEIMVSIAVKRGLAGVVLNGSIRDAFTLREGDFPVFAAGVTHRGPYKDGPGEINVPIAIAGMVIEPGDLVIGDDDGVLCVPYEQAHALHDAARAKMAQEAQMMAAIQAGTLDIAWIDATLQRIGWPPKG